MEDNKENALNEFLNNKKSKTEKDINSDENSEFINNKEEILSERTGLIERVNSDRILVTRDGKQLLREQY